VLYNFWGLKYCYIMLYGGGGCQKISIFALYNMWTTPKTINEFLRLIVEHIVYNVSGHDSLCVVKLRLSPPPPTSPVSVDSTTQLTVGLVVEH